MCGGVGGGSVEFDVHEGGVGGVVSVGVGISFWLLVVVVVDVLVVVVVVVVVVVMVVFLSDTFVKREKMLLVMCFSDQLAFDECFLH